MEVKTVPLDKVWVVVITEVGQDPKRFDASSHARVFAEKWCAEEYLRDKLIGLISDSFFGEDDDKLDEDEDEDEEQKAGCDRTEHDTKALVAWEKDIKPEDRHAAAKDTWTHAWKGVIKPNLDIIESIARVLSKDSEFAMCRWHWKLEIQVLGDAEARRGQKPITDYFPAQYKGT